MTRFFTLLLAAFSVGADLASADDAPVRDEPLKKLEDMTLPTVKELVKGPRIDWIVLENSDVLVVQAVYPRPNTLEKIETKRQQLRERVGRTDEQRAEIERQREEIRFLVVQLPGDDTTEYRLPVSKIAQIVHHEDLLLGRVRRLLNEADHRGAYELLFPLVRRSPDWPGIDVVQNELLAAQADRRLAEGRLEEALVFAEELYDRDRGVDEAVDRVARVADRLVAAAVDDEEFRRARYFLARLGRRLPGHEVEKRWRAELEGRARQLAGIAVVAEQAGEHERAVDLADRAAHVWPAAEGLRPLHERTWNRWQRLRVGVRDFGESAGPLPVRTWAQRRRDELTSTSPFEIDRVVDRVVYRHPAVRSWEPVDLGRGLELSFRRGRERWESAPPLTAREFVESVRRRVDPADRAYDERLAALVDRAVTTSPYDASVRFRRTPLRPEALLATVTRTDETSPTGRFRLAEPDPAGPPTVDPSGDSVRRFLRVLPEPDGQRTEAYHVAEIVERRYRNRDDALQALLRDEIDLLPHVRPFDVNVLAADERIDVRPLVLPRTHVLQFNWDSPALRNQSFRRAVAFATDVRRVMRDVVLRTENSPYGRRVTAPWPSRSTLYDGNVRPHRYDLGLAVALRLSAKRQLKSLPDLRVLVVGDDLAVEAAEEIVDDWRRAGITATVVTEAEYAGESEPRWDVLYRSVTMAEPLLELWPFLVTRPTARLQDLGVLPDWLRSELLALERTSSWSEAEDRMHRLHRALHDDVRYVPLWELDGFFALRTNVRPTTSKDVPVASVYRDVERWVVRPVYPTEPK